MPMYCDRNSVFEARCIHEDNIDDIASWAQGSIVVVQTEQGERQAIIIANEIAFIGDYISKYVSHIDEGKTYVNIIPADQFIKLNQEVII